MALITCKSCGRPVSDRAKFCLHCGSAIGNAQANAPQDAQRPEPRPATPSREQRRTIDDDPQSGGKSGLTTLLAVLAIAAVAGCGWLWYDRSQQEPTSGNDYGSTAEAVIEQVS